jgi:hypothetical protein
VKSVTHVTISNRQRTMVTGSVLGLALILGGLGGWLPLRPSAVALAFQGSDQPVIGAGIPQVGSAAPRSGLSNLKPGSLLFFPKYTSEANSPSRVNTLLTFTNTNPRDGVTVRLAYLHGCRVENRFLNLSGNQTQTLLASLESPGTTGSIIAFAVNRFGQPIQFNWLIGSASLRDSEGHEASYKAIAVAKRSGGAILSQTGSGENGMVDEVALLFNDQQYDRLPQVVALDHLQNQDPAQEAGPLSVARTDVTLLSPPPFLSDNLGLPLNVTAIAYDQSGRPYPQTIEANCGLSGQIDQWWTDPPLREFISPSRPGWASFAATSGGRVAPILGLSLSDGPSTTFHQARSMQVLRRVDSFTMRVPIIVPPGAAADVATVNQPPAVGNSLGASEMKAGSVLLFPRFTSGMYGTSRIVLTNTHPTQRARIRLILNGLAGTATTGEQILSLFPNQTTSIDPGEILADQKGWAIAIAIDARALPHNFNFLIGSSLVSNSDGQWNGYSPLAIAKNSSGAVARNTDVETSDLLFDDEQYDRLPSVLALNGLSSQVDHRGILGIARMSSDLSLAPNARGLIQISLIDAMMRSFAGVLSDIETTLSRLNVTASSPPIPLTGSILSGYQGWLRLTPSSPLLAWGSSQALVPFRAPAHFADFEGGFSGWTTPHILTTFPRFTTRTIALNPNNQAPIADYEAIEPFVEARTMEGTIVRLDGRVSVDPDPDDPLSYRWYDNDQLISTAAICDYRFSKGTHLIKLIVADGNEVTSEPKTHLLEVRDTTPPIISGIPAEITRFTTSQVGAGVNFTLPVAYDSVDGWVNISANPRPSSLFRLGRHTVTFTARDNSGNVATATMIVDVKAGGNFPQRGGEVGNKMPYLNNVNDQYLIPGTVRTYVLQAADPDNQPLTFQLLNAPSYARIDRIDPILKRAHLVMAPREGDQAMASQVRVVVRDSLGGTFTTLPFRMQLSDVENDETGSGVGPGGGGEGEDPEDPDEEEVEGPAKNRAPIARALPIPASVQATLKEGAVVKLDGSPSSDPDNDPMTYTWKDGATVIAEGAIVEAILAVGTHSITLTVSDGKGESSTTPPQAIEVLPRDLTVSSVTPARIVRGNITSMTIRGTGFNQQTDVQFECTSFCSGGSRVTITISSIDEDEIVLQARTTSSTPQGNRNLVVTNPGKATVRLTRSNFVN